MSSLKDSIKLEIEDGKKIYFASDNHLGAPSYSESKPRELIFVDWLNKVKIDAGQSLEVQIQMDTARS